MDLWTNNITKRKKWIGTINTVDSRRNVYLKKQQIVFFFVKSLVLQIFICKCNFKNQFINTI